MATIDIPHVQSFKDRHGKRRFYYRRAGYDRFSLPPPEHPDFAEAYERAKTSKLEIGASRTVPKSMDAGIILYYGSKGFKKLKPQTQATYRNILDRFRAEHGSGSAVTIETRHLDLIFEDWSDRPGALRNLRLRLKSVFSCVIKAGWRRDNPITETDKPGQTGPGFTPWTEEKIAAYRAKWASGTRERLAFELLLNAGPRRSDAVLLGPKHIATGRLVFTPTKTRDKTATVVTLIIHPDLARELAFWMDGETFLRTMRGNAFAEASFTSWFGEAADAAGCNGLTPHGLRKAAGRRLAEAGCSAKQIAAVLGHTTTRMAETYTKDADREWLSDAAFANLGVSNLLSNPENSAINTDTSNGAGRPGRRVDIGAFQRRRLSNRPNRPR